ncbi:MAG: two-component sensor histidine kinase, partial [Cyanothece sp. SIO1E1]|nr:two-component sensor histidine kinase [Cyanothece sp. SIO1E1]
MHQHKLFQVTRWRLTSFYAGVMGLILSLCSLGVYEAIAYVHRVTIDKELRSVAGTLHDGLEATLKQPGRLERDSQRFLPDVCIGRNPCVPPADMPERHILGVVQQGNYYIRLLDNSGTLVASAGMWPAELPITASSSV